MSTRRKRHTEVRHFDDAVSVGLRLREARVRAGLSQRQLSFPGCSTAYLSRIESGQRTPSLQLMRELARRLDVTEGYLAYGEEPGAKEVEPLLEAELALRMDDRELAEKLYRGESESDDRWRRAGGIEGLGQLAFRDGRPQDAIELLEQAAELYGEAAGRRSALSDTLGRAYAAVGDFEAAIGVYERALRGAQERESVVDTVRFSTLLSYALADAGRLVDAGSVLATALSHADELADPQARVRLFWAQCRLHVVNDRPDLAERYARKAIELLELTEDSYHLARAYRLMANVEIEQGHGGEAIELLDKAEATLGESGGETEQALNRLVRARALAELGELDEAAALAMSLTGALAALPQETGRTYLLLSRTFAGAGDRERALELAELACEFLEETPNRSLVEAYSQLAELLEAEGRKDDALEILHKAVRLKAAVAERT